jgi:hypothetical protein
MARMDLVIHHLDGGQAWASFGPVLIRVITTAPTDLATAEVVSRLMPGELARWPMVGLWIVAHHGAPLPDNEFRRGFGPMLRPWRDRLVVVLTPLGLGFWAKSAVMVSATLSKLAGQQQLIETTLERGAARMGLELIGVDSDKLVASHDELLAAMQTAAKVA